MKQVAKPSLPSEVAHETTTGAAIQAQVEFSNADKETQPKEDFELSKGQIISFTAHERIETGRNAEEHRDQELPFLFEGKPYKEY